MGTAAGGRVPSVWQGVGKAGRWLVGAGEAPCLGEEGARITLSLQGLLRRAERLAGGEHADGEPPGPGGAAGELRSPRGAAELLVGRAEHWLPSCDAGPQCDQPPRGAPATPGPGDGR